MCPSDDGTEQSTVGTVERKMQGFRAFFAHPLWTAVREGTLVIDRIDAAIRQTSSFSALQKSAGCDLSGEKLITRLRHVDNAIEAALVTQPTLDSLSVLIILAHDPYLVGSSELTSFCLIGYQWHVPMLRQMAEFRGISGDLTTLIDSRFEQILRAQGHEEILLRTHALSDEQLLSVEE